MFDWMLFFSTHRGGCFSLETHQAMLLATVTIAVSICALTINPDIQHMLEIACSQILPWHILKCEKLLDCQSTTTINWHRDVAWGCNMVLMLSRSKCRCARVVRTFARLNKSPQDVRMRGLYRLLSVPFIGHDCPLSTHMWLCLFMYVSCFMLFFVFHVGFSWLSTTIGCCLLSVWPSINCSRLLSGGNHSLEWALRSQAGSFCFCLWVG